MTLALSSLRSHFFKHLQFYNRASNLLSLRRRIHRHPPPTGFFIFPPVEAAQLSRLFTAVANYSTPPSNNGAHYTSPYLSVHICCPKNLSVRHFFSSSVPSQLACICMLFRYVDIYFCFFNGRTRCRSLLCALEQVLPPLTNKTAAIRMRR